MCRPINPYLYYSREMKGIYTEPVSLSHIATEVRWDRIELLRLNLLPPGSPTPMIVSQREYESMADAAFTTLAKCIGEYRKKSYRRKPSAAKKNHHTDY